MIEAPIIVSEQQLQYQVMGHNHPPSTIIQDMLYGLDSESVELPVSQERGTTIEVANELGQGLGLETQVQLKAEDHTAQVKE